MSRPPDDPAAFQTFLNELRRSRSDPSALHDSAHLAALEASMRRLLPRNDRLRWYLESKDLSQLGVVELIKRIDGFKGTTWPELVAYARLLTKHAKIDEFRRAPGSTGGPEKHATIENPMVNVNQPTPSRIMSDEEQREILARAVKDLPEDLRRAIEMRLDNRDYEAIAKELGVSVEATYQRVSRGLARLRERLSGVLGANDG